jgi:hypothetical protein
MKRICLGLLAALMAAACDAGDGGCTSGAPVTVSLNGDLFRIDPKQPPMVTVSSDQIEIQVIEDKGVQRRAYCPLAKTPVAKGFGYEAQQLKELPDGDPLKDLQQVLMVATPKEYQSYDRDPFADPESGGLQRRDNGTGTAYSLSGDSLGSWKAPVHGMCSIRLSDDMGPRCTLMAPLTDKSVMRLQLDPEKVPAAKWPAVLDAAAARFRAMKAG